MTTTATPPPSTPARPASADEPPTIGSFRGSPTIRLTPGREAEQMQAAVEAIHRRTDAAGQDFDVIKEFDDLRRRLALAEARAGAMEKAGDELADALKSWNQASDTSLDGPVLDGWSQAKAAAPAEGGAP